MFFGGQRVFVRSRSTFSEMSMFFSCHVVQNILKELVSKGCCISGVRAVQKLGSASGNAKTQFQNNNTKYFEKRFVYSSSFLFRPDSFFRTHGELERMQVRRDAAVRAVEHDARGDRLLIRALPAPDPDPSQHGTLAGSEYCSAIVFA